jgi:hypothetical protein
MKEIPTKIDYMTEYMKKKILRFINILINPSIDIFYFTILPVLFDLKAENSDFLHRYETFPR